MHSAMKKIFITAIFASLAWGFASCPLATAFDNPETAALVDQLASKSRSKIMEAVEGLGGLADGDALEALEALSDNRLRRDEEGRAVVLSADDEKAVYAVDRTPFEGDLESLDRPIINNRVRRELNTAIAQLQLFSKKTEVRLAAASELAGRPRPDAADQIVKALEKETDDEVAQKLRLALALIQIEGGEKEKVMEAIASIGDSGDPNLLSLLTPLAEQETEAPGFDKEIRDAARSAVSSIKTRMVFIRSAQDLFYGLSLGSVLLLAALGLAITFGLMGVINMAHGEMLMLGAYATYATQNFFQAHMPGAIDWYLVAAIPVAFAVSCLVGIVLERSVIRFLYGRPLETLLATWGISLLLIQTVRLIFGAQNVEVANPSWLAGGFAPVTGMMVTYNRLAIIFFVIVVVAGVWLVLNKTSLGLKVRCVTQNRQMASSMGIHTLRVDMWTFGLGSGIAGLGGVALSQVGNVGPELGQGYIVDCFMVVVLGGVGKLAGTIFGASGLGIINKFLEPHTGAVLGKIFVLAFIILFIQKRPQGLFAQRTRAA